MKADVMTFRPMPILTVFLIAGLAVLIWLGNWQWHRYNEKLALVGGPAVTELVTLDIKPLDEPVQFAYSTYDGRAIWRVFRPVSGCVISSSGARSCDGPLFVDVALLDALTPEVFDQTALPDIDQAAGFRAAPSMKRSLFALVDQPEKYQWYTSNAVTMATSLKLDNPEQALLIEPVDIIRINESGAREVRGAIENPFANPAILDDLPPARHLGYALTWYGLAIGMIGVYLALHISRRRLVFGKSDT